MWSAFSNGVKKRLFVIRIFAYLIARSYLTIDKQNARIRELEKELKSRRR
jgi:hypothetical protein